MIDNIIRAIIPRKIKDIFYHRLDMIIKNYKTPKIIWGYQNPSGEWRERTRISDTVFFNHPERIFISDNVFVGHYSILDGTGGLEIGEGTQIAAWNGIYTHSSHIAIRLYGKHYQDIPESEKIMYHALPVIIGKYVFIGAGAMIFPGITIGNGALVSAGAIVTHDVDSFQIITGNPAKVIGDTRILDQKYLNDNPKLLKWYKEWQT
jgi:acetyltransferase-like isoleucine patch superfamily enzyme